MLPTLREIIGSPALQAGDPDVVSGSGRLDRPVRWVHVSEVSDLSGLLSGGELILSTGLPLTADGGTDYVERLVSASAAGLVLDPGVPVPPTALARARELDFPVIIARRTVRFVEITEQVHRAIVAEQYALVEFSRTVHEQFTRLSLESADADQIVAAAAQLCGSSVVLEDLARHVVAHRALGRPTAGLLARWAERSRVTPLLDTTGLAGPEGWMTTPVGVRGQSWGRLVVTDPQTSQERLSMVLERAAQALELGRMVERDRLGLAFQAQGGLLQELAEGRLSLEEEAIARARSLGLGRSGHYLAVVVRQATAESPTDPVAAHGRSRRLVERVSDGVRTAKLRALVGAYGADVGVLLSGADEPHLLAALADALGADLTLGVGHGSSSMLTAGLSLPTAQHVAEVAGSLPGPRRPYYRTTDVRLHGLVALLHDDRRVQSFAEAELGRLLEHEASHGQGLVDLLRQYVDVGGNKTRLALVSHRSRPLLYKKLAQIERILETDLSDPLSLRSLGVALMVHDHAR